ncbi:MAG: hypothetical protein IV090_03365 [Candidatus Sericytochromatia bacterium]|nr:hypothetical protein [Candidatus Sericytochromatia bacterium]
MRKRLKHLLPLLLCLHLQGCVWTVYNWREIPDPDTIEQYQSKAEKLEHYQKYAIQDLKFKSTFILFDQMAFSTLFQPQTYYDLNSYAPVIYQLAPETETHFAQAQNLQLYREIVNMGGLILAFVFCFQEMLSLASSNATQDSEIKQKSFDSSLWMFGGIVALLGADIYLINQEQAQYAKIKETYNAALRKQLELEETDLGALPPPSLALSWESPQ